MEERQIYRSPEYGTSTLAHKADFEYAIIKPGNFDDLPRIAEELGFSRSPDFPTRRSHWQIYGRPQCDIPNLLDVPTKISSSLALYDTEEELTHAILRTAKKPYSPDEFARDLSAFTRHFIERPRLLGFPSQELTKDRTVAAAMIAGTIVGALVAPYIVGEEQSFLVFLDVLNGTALGGFGSAGLRALSERRARRSISHPEQYIVGDDVRNTLAGEDSHRRLVALLEEAHTQELKNPFRNRGGRF